MLPQKMIRSSAERSPFYSALRISAVAVAILFGAFVARSGHGETIYALASQGAKSAIVTFDTATPGTLTTVVLSSYYDAIDFRPADGRLYVLDAYGNNGAGNIRRLTPGSLQPDSFFATFSNNLTTGFNWGFDFDPVANQARAISETGQNIGNIPVTNSPPNTFGTAFPNVAYAAGDPNFGVHPNIVDIAYSNNVPNAVSSILYGIDTGLDVLVTINQTTSAVTTVGPLGFDANAAGGFDISRYTGTAYAVLLPSNSSNSRLYSINLATGGATSLGSIDGGILITGMTVTPEPTTVGLMCLGVALVACARRRV